MDFIKYKVLLRTALASIYPLISYTIGWTVYKLAVDTEVKYFNWFWIAIGIFVLVPPIS